MSLFAMIALALAAALNLTGQTNVVNPTASTIMQYQPGVIPSSPTQTATFVSTYLSPLLASVNYTPLTSPALTSQITIQFYSDGSSKMKVFYAAPLPNPPPGL